MCCDFVDISVSVGNHLSVRISVNVSARFGVSVRRFARVSVSVCVCLCVNVGSRVSL